jgi:hypothetical protein
VHAGRVLECDKAPLFSKIFYFTSQSCASIIERKQIPLKLILLSHRDAFPSFGDSIILIISDLNTGFLLDAHLSIILVPILVVGSDVGRQFGSADSAMQSMQRQNVFL